MHGETSIRIELTDFLLDILGDGFIPAMDGKISDDNFRQKRKRMRDGIRSDFVDEIHLTIGHIADKIVLLRGEYDNPNPKKQILCYQVSGDVKKYEDERKEKYPHKYYSETYWNSWELITTLINNMRYAKTFHHEKSSNEAIFYYVRNSLKTMDSSAQEPHNLDLKEYFTAFEDVLKNREPRKSFFKYPFNHFSDYLQKNAEYKLEEFIELWNEKINEDEEEKVKVKDDFIHNLRYQKIIKRNWKPFCNMLYDPDYLSHETQIKNKILNLFDIQIEFTTQEETKYYFVKETESTKKNFELKLQYRLFQARLFVAYLLNNMYAAMKERGFNTEQIEEMFDDIHHYALQNPTGE
ncbi:MAG TPA: hypothetical protein DEQ14_07120 [Treponema sp.]|nr:hypothetical protein [Treponema sp.]